MAAKGKWVAAPSYHGLGGGSVRINPPAVAAPYVPQPLPPGSYNPERDLQVEQGARGLTQAEAAAQTQREREQADIAIGSEKIATQRGQQKTDYEKAKQLLGESFQRLAGRQGEQANTAGVLSGGAVLASAAARAANEGKQAATQTEGYERQGKADDEALAALQLSGGRTLQDITTNVENAQSNQAFFAKGSQGLDIAEATRPVSQGGPGYIPPAPPPVPASVLATQQRERERAGGVKPTGWVQQKGGAVRVGYRY